MRSLVLLIKRNLRKRRGQAIAILLLALLGGALLNLGTIMATAYSGLVNNKLEQANAADVSAIIPSGTAADRVIARLRDDRDIRDMEVERTVIGTVDTEFGNERVATSVVIHNVDNPPKMGTWREVSRTDAPLTHPIWAPKIYETAGGFDLGDPITFTTPTGDTTFHIQGFIEHPTLGMPAMGALGFAVPTSDFNALVRNPQSGFRSAQHVKLMVVDGVRPFDVIQRSMVDHNERHPNDRARSLLDTSTDLLRTGATIGSSIFAGGFVAFALIIAVVALVVMRFLVVNAVSDDMQSLGVLRACGFSTRGMVLQLSGTFAACAFVGSVIGVASSYLVLPSLAGALSDQTGLIWNSGFHPRAAAVTVAAFTGAVLVVAALAARRLRQQSTIDAMRGGTRTHSFTRNPFPLAETGGRLNVLLGLKAAFQRIPQQALVGITVTVVAFTTVLAIGMSANVLGNRDAFMRLVVGDLPDAQIAMVDQASVPAMVAEARRIPGVERVFLSELNGVTINGYTASIQVMDDYRVIRYDSTYRGRAPRHPDEISLGSKLAQQLNVDVGQRIRLDIGGYTAEYLVSGLLSTSRGLGMTADITTAGMRRADASYQQRIVSMHIADGYDIDEILTTLSRRHAGKVEAPVNMKSNMDGQMSGYQAMVSALSNVIVVFMAVMVVLVIALIISTMIIQNRRTYGVLKAVGFGTGDLHRQTLITWLPVIAVGGTVGAILGAVSLNPSLGLMLRFIGIRRADFTVEWWLVPVLALILTLLAAVVVRLAARGLGRVSAYALVSE